ncbi:hypothetical protein PINS_up001685 [Pythium insidiosum]|nr:hypothetical protein PINS_up001685 [Pythium insidiosum]
MPPERHEHEDVAATALREGEQLLQCDADATRVNYNALRTPSDGLRVNKWDARILDGEIVDLLRAPFRSMFSMFDAGTIDRIKPEMDLVLASIFFWSSTGMRRPTPGMKLENVEYLPQQLTRRRVYLLYILSLGIPYAWKRIFRVITSSRWRASANTDDTGETREDRRASLLQWMKRIETLALACQFFNLMAFLRNGVYRSLPERILGLRLRSIAPMASSRVINFEYMTRQLLWDGLMEFGSFLLPMLTWSRARAPMIASSGSDPRTRGTQCNLCGLSPPQTPYMTSCRHVYCYYCLQTAVAQDEEFSCAACGVKFDSSQRLRA